MFESPQFASTHARTCIVQCHILLNAPERCPDQFFKIFIYWLPKAVVYAVDILDEKKFHAFFRNEGFEDVFNEIVFVLE